MKTCPATGHASIQRKTLPVLMQPSANLKINKSVLGQCAYALFLSV